MSAFEPLVVHTDQDGLAVWEFGDGLNRIKCLMSAKETGGKLAFFENLLKPGAVVPPHIHHNEDEYWYMLDDGIEVQLGSERFSIKANSLIAIPAGTEHGVVNIGDGDVRALFFTTPGGLEQFFAGLSQLLASTDSKPEDFAMLFQSTGTTFTDQN